ncbi:Acetyl esterase/lipase [Methylophilus rhizosphaerae]|uniref:Acetyl esterase/lipase n=1 Tax=Methylophilus rhizosphaerae TaxID=492660 RepID=A0A1G9BUV2_9PROT|nr:alpha/beta hydrolase [Methylophilus rhizosphaerae]SDK43248.1 Acetyl esterase/lipase [Methylophilus rhizosphaerae]
MATTHHSDSLLNQTAGTLPAIEDPATVEAATKILGGEPPYADPDMQLVLDALTALGGKPIESLSPEEARRQPTPADAVKKVLQAQGLAPATAHVSCRMISIPGGPIGSMPAHVYTPAGEGPFPVTLYFHGGGFVIADTKTYEASIIALAQGAQTVVVSLDYHQAPEHRFPTQPNEAFVAYQWLLKHAHELKGDRKRIAVAGESAGGNLAAVVSLMSRDKDMTLPVHQLLIYPVVDNNVFNASYLENAHAKPLNAAMMHWFFKHYSEPMDTYSAYALPNKAASLKELPPATVITADIDPLHEEGKDFAERLESDGVPVAYRHYRGVTHEFFGMADVVAKAREAQVFAIGELRQAFA